MSDFPDVLGMELHDATALLESEGLDFIIIETKPTKKELTEGVLRVIKVQPKNGESTEMRADDAQPNQTTSDITESKQSVVLTVCRI